MSRHSNGQDARNGGSGTGRHANDRAARAAAILLRTGCTPESVEQSLRLAAQGNGGTAVPAPRSPEDARQAAS
jgi:hypothetical protein